VVKHNSRPPVVKASFVRNCWMSAHLLAIFS
jgi:hypothetical protein